MASYQDLATALGYTALGTVSPTNVRCCCCCCCCCCRDDYKEGERKKLADLVRGMAAGENSGRASSPKMAVLNLQVRFRRSARKAFSSICSG
jgi:hypothetical protein